MAHAFNTWGWYVGVVADGTPRSVSQEPLNMSVSETPGALRSNYTGSEWIELPYTAPEPMPEPAPELPDEVDRWKAHFVLASAGLMPAVRAAIAAIEDDTERAVAEVLFEQRPTIRRISALTQRVQQAVGISDAERDAMFVQAFALQAVAL